jgi:hypothetical protein
MRTDGQHRPGDPGHRGPRGPDVAAGSLDGVVVHGRDRVPGPARDRVDEPHPPRQVPRFKHHRRPNNPRSPRRAAAAGLVAPVAAMSGSRGLVMRPAGSMPASSLDPAWSAASRGGGGVTRAVHRHGVRRVVGEGFPTPPGVPLRRLQPGGRPPRRRTRPPRPPAAPPAGRWGWMPKPATTRTAAPGHPGEFGRGTAGRVPSARYGTTLPASTTTSKPPAMAAWGHVEFGQVGEPERDLGGHLGRHPQHGQVGVDAHHGVAHRVQGRSRPGRCRSPRRARGRSAGPSARSARGVHEARLPVGVPGRRPSASALACVIRRA